MTTVVATADTADAGGAARDDGRPVAV